MLINSTIKRTYWLIFKPGSHWYCRFLKRHYGHVFVLTNDGKQWMVLEPCAKRLYPIILDCDINVNVPKIYTRTDYSVVKIVLNEQETNRGIFRPFYFISCVEMVKYIIGLRMLCFTPFGLYRKLLKLKKQSSKNYGIDNIDFIY